MNDDRVLLLLQRRDHRLEALLEVAAVARPRHHRSHVERVDDRARERRRRLAQLDPPRQPLDDGGLAHAGVADEQRVVLAAARQHVQRALDLRAAPDQRIDLARPRPLVQVDRVLGQRIDGRLFVLVVAGRRAPPCPGMPVVFAGSSFEMPCEM